MTGHEPIVLIRWHYVLVTILVGAALGVGAAMPLSPWRHQASSQSTVIGSDGVRAPHDMVWIRGGEFVMGSTDRLAKPNERPAHKVRVHGFWMDRTVVTNAQFAAFVAATGYVTTAERSPDWETLNVQLPADTPKPQDNELVAGGMVFVGTDQLVDMGDYSQWWRYIPGASWKHPQGPQSSIADRRDYPVVQVSYDDALAYAHWARKRLPTEAEWEFAARGGLEQATYAWGNEFAPQGRKMANVWDGSAQPFPITDPLTAAEHGPSRVCTFPPNGYGLCDITGNVWQWVADWYRADAFRIETRGAEPIDPRGPRDSYDPDDAATPVTAPKRVIRGGSFLCSREYCLGYRPSARRGADPYTSTSHIGFRLVAN
jgi:formylglycine-generating enzyme